MPNQMPSLIKSIFEWSILISEKELKNLSFSCAIWTFGNYQKLCFLPNPKPHYKITSQDYERNYYDNFKLMIIFQLV